MNSAMIPATPEAITYDSKEALIETIRAVAKAARLECGRESRQMRGHGETTFRGLVLSKLVFKAQYWGAGVADPRGLSDTGLTKSELEQMLECGITSELSDRIGEYCWDD